MKFLGLLLLASLGYAQSLIQTEIVHKGRVVSIYCLGSIPGTAKGDLLVFTSFKKQIKRLLSKPLTPKIEKKIKKLKAYKKLGTPACENINRDSGNFDLNGNATIAGKTLFGIPLHLEANITQGRAVYETYCVGCHVERTNYTFPVVREAIKQSPMLYDESQIPDQTLAHLIAYFNRFRL